jgi:hypothetical protein
VSTTGKPRVLDRWFPVGASGKPYGGGIWGPGGVSTDGSSLYAATGNAIPFSQEAARDAESVVQLSADLRPRAADHPSLDGFDVDFGATPLLYRNGACVAVVNKSGALLVYAAGRIGDGAKQRLQVGDVSLSDDFIGMPAYDPDHGLVLVDLTSDSGGGPYRHGLVAFRAAGDCSLSLAWQRGLPGLATPSAPYPSIPPTVANGVVYVVRANSAKVYALDAASGAVLWNNGQLHAFAP